MGEEDENNRGHSTCTTQADNWNLDPLDVPNILREVVQYLSSAELPIARLVNKTWNKEANHFISKIAKTFESLQLKHSDDTPSSSHATPPPLLGDLVLDAVSNPNLLSIFKTFVFTDCDPGSRQWKAFLILFGPHLDSLEISTWTKAVAGGGRQTQNPSSNYCYNFEEILNAFSRLTTLHLRLSKCKWKRPTMATPETQTAQLDLPTLKNLTVCSRVLRQGEPSTSTDWIIGSYDYEQEEIWAVLKTIVKAAPNLNFLETQQQSDRRRGSYNFPGHLIKDIFTDPSLRMSNLDSLRLGSFGPVMPSLSGEYAAPAGTSWSQFFNILTGSPGIARLRSLKLPRPSHATPVDWNNLFSLVASTLIDLDLSQVDMNGNVFGDLETLDEIPFKTRMLNLRTLTLHASMLPLAENRTLGTSPSPIFPGLEQLTVCLNNLEDPLRKRKEKFCYRFEGNNFDLNIFRCVKKLVLVLVEQGPDAGQPVECIFKILATQLPSVVQLELRNVPEFDVLRDVYGAYFERMRLQDDFTTIAESITILSLKDLKGYHRFHKVPNWRKLFAICGEIEPEFVNPTSDSEDPDLDPPCPCELSLSVFKNLKTFFLGFENRADSIRVTPHFVTATIANHPNLECLEFKNLLIDRRAMDDLTALPGPGRLTTFKTYDCEICECDGNSHADDHISDSDSS